MRAAKREFKRWRTWSLDDLFEVKGRSTSRLYGFVLFDAESGSLECSQAGLADGDSHEGLRNQRVNICEMRREGDAMRRIMGTVK